MTPWVNRLLVVNILVYLVLRPGTLLYDLLTLYPPAVVGIDRMYIPGMPFRPWTLVTYMFLHAGLGHVFWNMLMLFFFGPRVEARMGGRGFLLLYFLSGIGGAAFAFAFSFASPVVGASAAVYGVLMGFVMYWPREPIYIYGVLPVPAGWLAAALVFLSLYSGVAGSGGNTAHFAHLGGLVWAVAFLRLRDRYLGKNRREFKDKVNHTASMDGSEREARMRWASINLGAMHDLNRSEVEELLARVDRDGIVSLSLAERQFLDRASGR